MRGGDEEQRRRAAGSSTTSLSATAELRQSLDEVRVGEHAALGLAGRARRVDERRDVGADGEVAAPLDLLVGDAGAAGDELVEVAEVDLPDVADGGRSGCTSSKRAKWSGVSRMIAMAPESLRFQLHLRGRARLVDRHEHRAREPRGEVDQRPLVARLAHEADLVAGLDAGRDEALGEGDDLVVELAGRDGRPPAVGGGEGEQHGVGRRRDAVDEQVGRVRLGVGGDHGGGIEFDHGSSFGTGEDHARLGLAREPRHWGRLHSSRCSCGPEAPGSSSLIPFERRLPGARDRYRHRRNEDRRARSSTSSARIVRSERVPTPAGDSALLEDAVVAMIEVARRRADRRDRRRRRGSRVHRCRAVDRVLRAEHRLAQRAVPREARGPRRHARSWSTTTRTRRAGRSSGSAPGAS